jgi:hypothetical protein
MNIRDIQQDPFYQPIIYRVESHIWQGDQDAQSEESLTVNDSDIKSALRKAMTLLAGKQPKSTPRKAKDRWKDQLATGIVGIHGALDKDLGITRAEFKLILLTIEGSLKLHRDRAGHQRGYLDFLHEFIPDMKARETENEP